MLIPKCRGYTSPLCCDELQQFRIRQTRALFQHRNVSYQVRASDSVSRGYISSSVPSICLFVQFFPFVILITELLQLTKAMYTDVVLGFTSLHRIFPSADREYNGDPRWKYSPSDRFLRKYQAVFFGNILPFCRSAKGSTGRSQVYLTDILSFFDLLSDIHELQNRGGPFVFQFYHSP